MTGAKAGSTRRLLLAYAESSGDLVKPLWRAFEAAGFTVQSASDNTPPAHDAIDAANAVVVCWTPAAVASDVVNLQAARAQKARKLVPILLAPCSPPGHLGGRFRAADLSGWRGDPIDKEFRALVQSLHARLSGRMFSGGLWNSHYLSWGGAGAATLAAIALIANFGDLRQAFDGIVNPAASEAALTATDAKVEEVLTLLKQKSPQPLSADTEAALRESIERLLSAQSGARGNAAAKLEAGDILGALADLRKAAEEGEKAAAGLSETWQEIGALAYADETFEALDAYKRAVELAPKDYVARTQLGNLYLRTGNLDAAYAEFEAAMLDSDDEAITAIAYGNLGTLALIRGDLEQARSNFSYALGVNEKLGSIEGQASDLGDLGEIARIDGNFAQAEAHIRRSRDFYRQAGHREGEGVAISRLGAVARDRARYDEAEKLFNEALQIATEIADSEGQAFALSGLGDVALDRGRLVQSKTHYAASLEAADRMSARESTAVAQVGLGNVAEREGDKIGAIGHFREAKFIYDQMGLAQDSKQMLDRMLRLGATPSDEGPEN